MSVRSPEDEPSISKGKRRRINEEEEQPNVFKEEAPKQLAIAAALNEGNEGIRPQIFKLDVDCVQEIFDWLSIRDIHSVAETCTRMQRIAGDYFQPNLAALQLDYHDDGFKMHFGANSKENKFKEFVQKLRIDGSVNEEGFRFIGQHCKSLKQIIFKFSKLSATRIRHIKPILSKIETVVFIDAHVFGEFYARFLKFCPNLKHLRIYDINSKIIIGAHNNWWLQTYSMLEHLELDSGFDSFKIPELRTFFERNPSLKKLSINACGFLKNIDAMMNTEIKLEVLAIEISEGEESIVCRHLNQLHDLGFYRRLHLKMNCYIDQRSIDMLSSLHGVEKLCLEDYYWGKIQLNLLEDLKELILNSGIYSGIYDNRSSIDLQSAAKRLVNLERLFIRECDYGMIEPFIEYSAKLKAIKIEYAEGENSIDLSTFNKKREKLVGARKITIYLNEKSYLATKWSNKTVDFKMIEVKREESVDWQIPFTF